MSWLYALSLNPLIIFTLVLSRISGLVMTAPVFGSLEVPAQVRALLALALSLVIVPTQLAANVPNPTTLVDYAGLVAGELVIGLVLGLGVQILFLAPQVAGQIISQLSGVSLADVFNPSLETEIPLFSQLLYLFSLAIFLTVGGHRLVMSGMLNTFETLPLGGGHLLTSISVSFTTLVTQSLDLGIRAAAPATAALLLATLILGLIGRTVPQLNIMALGFGISAMATLGMLSLSLGGIAGVFEAQIEPFLEALVDQLHGARD